MMAFQIFVCIAAVIASGSVSWADIPYNEVHVNIFDSQPRDFELRVLRLMKSTQNFYAEHNVTSIIDILAERTPYVKELIQTVRSFHETTAEQSQWRLQFTKAISDETLREIAESERRRMKSTMQMIETKIKILGENNSDVSNRKTIASILHTELDKLINFFDLKSSLFRKYPLMGTPPLIQLASLIAIFSPFAKALNPLEAMNPQISCKMRDVLLDYCPRTVNARLHQLYASRKSIFKNIVQVMSMPYNQYGYNETNPGVIHCERGCKISNETVPNELCLKDEFSTDEYYGKLNESMCIEDMAALIRHRVEELFPIVLLDKICVESEPKMPTGFGWFTINMQTVFTYGEADGSTCKLFSSLGCDSYIKLFVNSKEMFKSPTTKNAFVYDADITYTTGRISKNSTIEIEIRDASAAFWEYDALILKTKGNVDSFLNEPLRAGAEINHRQNSIETVSFWQDEHKEIV